MSPPRLARRLLGWLLPALDRDVILADLDGEFSRRTSTPSPGAARRWYWRQVVTSIPGALRLRTRFPWAEFVRDTRHGLRLLRRHPAFTVAAVLTLTLGIGTTSAVFTMAHAVLLRPLPYADPDRLVSVMELDRARDATSGNVSWPDFLDYQRQNGTLEGLAGYSGGSRTLTEPGQPAERVRAVMVTGNFFDLLGVRAALGRTPGADDTPPPADPVVVLSDAAWRARYGADPAVIGRVVGLNGRRTTIVGVLPASFEFPPRGGAELWLPLQPSSQQVDRKYFHWLDTIGRLRPGVTRAQAEADLDRIARAFASVDPRYHATSGAGVLLLRERMVGNVRPLLLILTAASALVLLVACANLAGLLLARSVIRRAELTLRMAMGAGRARLFRQLLAENLALVVPGGLAGIVVGHWLTQGLVSIVPPAQLAGLPYLASIGLDWRAVSITAAITIAAALAFGLAPAWIAARLEGAVVARGVAGDSARELRLQARLIAVQVALALVLLAGAGLMGRSLRHLLDVSPGFDPHRLLTLSVALPVDAGTTAARVAIDHDRLLERLRGLPGVAAATSINQLPLTGRGDSGSFTVRGDAEARETASLVRTIDAGYFETMGIPIVRGRAFTPADRPEAPPVVVVNQRLADTVFAGDPLGERITFPFTPGVEFEIVGVAGNEMFGPMDGEVLPVIYWPFAQDANNQFSLVLRVEGDPAAAAAPVRAALAAFDSRIPVFGLAAMDAILDRTTAVFHRRSVWWLFAVFAGATLALAAIGLHGVLAQVVARRTREIGVRVALGAGPWAIAGIVLRRVAAAVGMGLAAGIAGGALLGHALRGLLFGTSPADPATFAAVGIVLALAAAAACILPLRRAVRVDPVEALRGE